MSLERKETVVIVYLSFYMLLIRVLFQIQAQPTQLNSALLKSVFVEDLDVLIVSSEDGNICKCLYMFHEISLALKINPRPSVSLHSDAILRHCHIPIVIVAFWFIR